MFCLHCHMFTRFRIHWVETCHCAEFRFLNWRSFKLKHLKTVWIHWTFFPSQAITARIAVHCRALLHDHCRALWQLWLPQLLEGLSSTQLSLTVVWLTSHWEGSTNWWRTHWECLHWPTKVFQPLKCWHQHWQSLRLLRSTTYCWSPKLSLPWELTVRHWRALHWAKNGFRQLLYLAAWLMDCMGFAMQSLAQTVPATAFHWQHCIPADVRTGRHWRMRRHCFPTVRYRTPPTHWRSSTAMATVDLRLWRSWLDWLSKVMWSPLARLHKACALRPHWALPRRSWTLDWFLWNCSLTPKWTTGFAQGLHCWGHCRSTGQVTLTHWMFRNRWHWSSTILDWRGILPRPLFMDWRAWRKDWSVHWLQSTVLGPLLDYWIPATGCSVEHCGVTGFGILLPFTVKELMEPLQMELNCNKIFGTNCRGLVGHCILTVNQLELMHEDVITDCSWQSLFTDEPLPKKSRSRLATSQEETGTAKVDVKITGLPVGSEEVTVTITGHWDWVYLRDLWGNCFWTLLCWLMYWSLGSRFTEEAHLHTAPRLIDTVQLITDCVFHWLASMIDHCMHVQVCDTDSLNQCQGEVLRYMHCTNTTAHSMTLSSILTAWLKPGLSTWLKSLTKRLTESTLVWLELLTVSCTGERSRIFSVCLFVCLFVCAAPFFGLFPKMGFTWFAGTTFICQACGSGYFQPSGASVVCDPCPAGSYQDATQSISCNRCPVGQYQDEEGSSSCKRCPTGATTRLLGSASALDCGCEAGSINVNDDDGTLNCVPCGEGLRCPFSSSLQTLLSGRCLPRVMWCWVDQNHVCLQHFCTSRKKTGI